jgi:hypothetical protein
MLIGKLKAQSSGGDIIVYATGFTNKFSSSIRPCSTKEDTNVAPRPA